MRIWIDAYEANVPQRLGSSQVAFELLRNFEKLDHQNEYTVLLPSTPLDDLPKEREGWRYKILRPKKLWTFIALPLAINSSIQKPDLFFSPTHYIPRFSSVKKIVTIFDLSFLHFPESFTRKDLWQLKNWTKYSIKKADHIVTISDSSKKDIIKNYIVKKQKITVAYPGFNEEIFKPIKEVKKINKILKKYGINGDYIIFVGTIQPRKNLIKLIEVFTKLENLKLVIVGKTSGLGRQGWKYEEILQKPKGLGIEDKVYFTGFVPDQDLNYLLGGAKAFILPSFWEGFGIPVVEAMAAGVPVIVSNVSSLPEIVGKAGFLVDPRSDTQIEQAIRTVITDKKLGFLKSKQGLEQAKKFSWQKMAKTILKIFEKI